MTPNTPVNIATRRTARAAVGGLWLGSGLWRGIGNPFELANHNETDERSLLAHNPTDILSPGYKVLDIRRSGRRRQGLGGADDLSLRCAGFWRQVKAVSSGTGDQGRALDDCGLRPRRSRYTSEVVRQFTGSNSSVTVLLVG